MDGLKKSPGMEALLSVADARQRMLVKFEPVNLESVPLEAAFHRVLGQDISAGMDWPPFANSSMDGYAVHSADLTSAQPDQPVVLRVIGDIPAGTSPSIVLEPGTTARIMTGAPIPQGADAVIPVEETDQASAMVDQPLPECIRIVHPGEAGAYIRPRGHDLKHGQTVLTRGQRIRAQDFGLLAMLGIHQVTVHRKPRIAILSTGDELVSIQSRLEPGKIHDANSYSLSALCRSCGADPVLLGIVPDQYELIRERLDMAADAGVDLILSSAGVSVGTYDYVRAVIESQGHLNFWRVNMRPGKPLAFGVYRDIPVVGLPGNPVSAFIGFEVFLRPVLARLAGESATARQTFPATLEEDLTSDGRESYLRGIVTYQGGSRRVRLTGHQGSGNLFSLVQANALLIVPSGVKSLPSGSEVQIWLLDAGS